MLRINNYRMQLDLTRVGFIRMGRIECPGCGADHVNEIAKEIRQREADVLFASEAQGHRCDTCGTLLVANMAVA